MREHFLSSDNAVLLSLIVLIYLSEIMYENGFKYALFKY